MYIIIQIFFVGKNRWLKYQISDYFYHSEEDKKDPNILPTEYKVPFYVSTEAIHEKLLLLASTFGGVYSKKNYGWCPAPSPSCIGDVSLWESIFQYVLHVRMYISLVQKIYIYIFISFITEYINLVQHHCMHIQMLNIKMVDRITINVVVFHVRKKHMIAEILHGPKNIEFVFVVQVN